MAKVKVGINGFGRIGRLVLRQAMESPNVEIVGINDLCDTKTLAHLLKYDSTHKKFKGEVGVEGDNLVVNGKVIKISAQRDPAQLPGKSSVATSLSNQPAFSPSASRLQSTSPPVQRKSSSRLLQKMQSMPRSFWV